MLTFPELSRSTAPKTKERTIDPTMRDALENGMEATAAQFTRFRREWDVTIEMVSPEDRRTLRNFVEKKAVAGANEFLFPDTRDRLNPETLVVKFATLPQYDDKDNTEAGTRSNCTFTLREV